MDASAPASGDLPVTWYRQRAPNRTALNAIIGVALVIYVFAGLSVFWLVTGSGTPGNGWTLTSLGELVWMGPLLAWAVANLLGARGPLARLYAPRVKVGVDHDSLWWVRDGVTGSIVWDDVLGINPSMSSVRAGEVLTVWDIEGRAAVRLPEAFSPIGRRGSTTLQRLAVATRPDLFTRSGGFWTRAVAFRKSAADDK